MCGRILLEVMRTLQQKIKSASILLFAVALLGVVAYATVTQAQVLVTSGYSWGGNFGYLKGNSCDDPSDQNCTQTYGIQIADDGTLSGYAWSSNIGWVSFEPVAVSGFVYDDMGNVTFQAKVDFSANGGNGPYPVKGWARACSVFVSGCSGNMKLKIYRGNNGVDEKDAWDGFINLSGTKTDGSAWANPVVVSSDKKKMTGYAWGGDVVGWVQMNFAVSEKNTESHSSPTISYFVSKCVDTPHTKPSLAWEAVGNVALCRISSAGTTEYPGKTISNSVSSKASGGVLDSATGYYYWKSGIPGSKGSQYVLECQGNNPTTEDPEISTLTTTLISCSDTGGETLKQCEDGIDNDGDGYVDFSKDTFTKDTPANAKTPDPGCTSAKDDSEANIKPIYIEH